MQSLVMQTTIALQTAGDEEVLVEVKDKPKQNKRKKKGNGKEKAAKKAQKRHTEMCDRAMQMMDRIGRFLDKYESETSESEKLILTEE